MIAQRALAALVSVALGLGLRALTLSGQTIELGLDPLDRLLAPGTVTIGLDGVVADDVALGRVTVTDLDLLDAEVVLTVR